VDTAYPRSEISAKSYFALGDLYEHTLFVYDSALAAYSRGRNEYPMADVTKLCVHRADYLTRYFQCYREILKDDTLLEVLRAPRDSTRAEVTPPRSADTVRAQGSGRPADTVRTSGPLRSPAPAPPLSIDSVNAKRENAVNELAGLFYATIGLPDSAEYWYTQVLQEYPSGRFVPRALYTLAQIYSSRDSVGSKPIVDSLYREIIRRFPNSPFASEARGFLGLPPEVPVVDEAEQAYDRAEGLLVKGDSAGAAEEFKKVARKYPHSPIASHALFAAGWIYENRLYNPDSAIASYAKLIALYPTSSYATSVSPKIAEVTQFQKQKLAAAADSLAGRKPLQGPRPAGADSLGKAGGFPSPYTGPAAADSTAAKKRLLIPPRKTTGNE